MAKPDRTEIATAASDPFIPSFQGVLQPMDEVLAARGGASALKLYDEIRRDPHAHAVLSKLKLEVVSREWAVFPASEASADKKIAEAVEAQLKAINFDRLTRGLLGAFLKGFARYHLHRDGAPDHVVRDWKAANTDLEKVSSGRIRLPLTGGDDPSSSKSGDVGITGPEPAFSKDRLGGWL